ncbi:MAG: putative toxin-antitoxin system toxin component, PIN family, partial [Bacteroidota bacterium]
MASKMKIVIDTNVLLVSVSQKSSWHWLYKAVIEKKLDVFLTTEILHEYEEKISVHWSEEVAQTVIRTLTELSSAHLITTYFRLGLIVNDEDDNKFADCAFAANADFLVSNDKHFNILNTISFPKINIITLQDFKSVMEKTIK